MSINSGGILPFRFHNSDLEVLLVHPGGPFWEGKDEEAWSISKGLFEKNEHPLDAARREFKEETGFEIEGNFIELGRIKQPSGKVVYVWAVEKDLDESNIVSNKFSLEWPKGSKVMREFPEVDRAEWFNVQAARRMILKGQRGFIDRLVIALDQPSNRPDGNRPDGAATENSRY